MNALFFIKDLKELLYIFEPKWTFMLRCDFTQDYCIGFDSEVLYTHLLE